MAVAQHRRDLAPPAPAPSAAPDHVHPQRQRQAGLGLPPLAQLGHPGVAALLVQQPALVDQQGGVDLARVQRVEDAGERGDGHHHRHQLRLHQPQHQPGGGVEAGDADPLAPQLGQRSIGCAAPPPPARSRAPPRPRAAAAGSDRPPPGRRPARWPPRRRPSAAASAFSAAVSARWCANAQPAGVDAPVRKRGEHEGVVGVDGVGQAGCAGGRHGGGIFCRRQGRCASQFW